MTQLSCKRGDTTSFLIRSRVVDLFAVDGLIYTVKTRFGDADTSAVLQKELAYGVEVLSSDTARVSLVHADTKPLDPAITYKWDLQAQQGGTVTTVDQGTLRVDADVTREVAVSISIIQVEPANPASLGAEVTARQSADLSLKTEISTSVSVEASARTSADASLSTALAAETSARVSTDTAHSNALALRVVKDADGNTERLNTVNFTVDPVGVTHSEGVAHWSPDDHCLELGTDQAGVYLQVGQESLVRVRNTTGSTLLNGKVVYINGSTGQRPTVALADNTVSASATKTIGVMTADLANNSDGYATTQGLVRDLNTSAFTDGATVYLGTAGNLTVTQPTAPNEIIRVGHVVKAHVTQGVLLVGVQHHQDAAEVPLSSIVGISATDVQGAVSELLSDITAETSARISGDASVSTALSTAISQRISADASLASALSVETSRAVSVEATKAPLASPTFTGTQTLPDPVMGSGTGKAWSGSWAGDANSPVWCGNAFKAIAGAYAIRQDVNGATFLNAASGQFGRIRLGDTSIAGWDSAGFTSYFGLTVTGLATMNGGSLAGSGAAKAWAGSWAGGTGDSGAWSHSALAADGNKYALRQNAAGATMLNAAAGQAITFRIENVNTGYFDASGAFTALNGITNYAADVTVSALLALTPAQSAAKRKATVTGAYRMDGTLGRVEAFWDGDATAGTWEICGAGRVTVTADAFQFLYSCAVAGVSIQSVVSRFRAYPMPTLGLAASAWSTSSGANAYANVTLDYLSWTGVRYRTGTTATGFSVRTKGLDLVNPGHNPFAYYRSHLSPIQSSNSTDTFWAFSGFVSPTLDVPSSQACAMFLYDPQDTQLLGVTNGNWWCVVRATSGLATVFDSGIAVDLSQSNPVGLAVYMTGSSVSFYIGTILVGAPVTTNFPDGVLSPREGIIKVSGTGSRELIANRQYFSTKSAA